MIIHTASLHVYFPKILKPSFFFPILSSSMWLKTATKIYTINYKCLFQTVTLKELSCTGIPYTHLIYLTQKANYLRGRTMLHVNKDRIREKDKNRLSANPQSSHRKRWTLLICLHFAHCITRSGDTRWPQSVIHFQHTLHRVVLPQAINKALMTKAI